MARRASKHVGGQTKQFADLQGGLNLSLPPDAIADNEFQEGTNIEYDVTTMNLRTRSGLCFVASYTGEGQLKAIFPYGKTDLLVAASCPTDTTRTELFKLTEDVLVSIGTIDGAEPLSYYSWEEKDKVLLAAGKKISVYDGVTLTEIAESPDTKHLGYYGGRVMAATYDADGISILKLSAVGDETNWTLDASDDSAAKEIQVGYKDGMEITAIAPLARDLLIFKNPGGVVDERPERGIIYRLIGIHPNWSVYIASPRESSFSFQATLPQGNIVYFLNHMGLMAAQATEGYKEIQIAEVGSKVNPALRNIMSHRSKLFHVPSRKEIWIVPGDFTFAYVMNYSVGKGAFTKLEFPSEVKSVCSQGRSTYLLLANSIYLMDPSRLDDDGVPIFATLRLKNIFPGARMMVKRLVFRYSKDSSCSVLFSIANTRSISKYPLVFSGGGDKAFLDYDVAALDTDSLVDTSVKYNVFTCQIPGWFFAPTFEIAGGGFSLVSFGLVMVEV